MFARLIIEYRLFQLSKSGILWLMQKSIPDNLRGKVLSISMSIVKLIAPLGLVISGMIINSVPVYIMTFAGGGILMLSNLMILNQKNKPA